MRQTPLTNGLQGWVAAPADTTTPEGVAPRDAQLPLSGTGAASATPADGTLHRANVITRGANTAVDSETPLAPDPTTGPTGAGAAKIGILIPVRTLTGESDDPAISWDRTWMLPASEARAIAADTTVKHDWYAVGVTKDTGPEAAAEGEISAGVGEVVTVTGRVRWSV